jgi:hypothetical protein
MRWVMEGLMFAAVLLACGVAWGFAYNVVLESDEEISRFEASLSRR